MSSFLAVSGEQQIRKDINSFSQKCTGVTGPFSFTSQSIFDRKIRDFPSESDDSRPIIIKVSELSLLPNEALNANIILSLEKTRPKNK